MPTSRNRKKKKKVNLTLNLKNNTKLEIEVVPYIYPCTCCGCERLLKNTFHTPDEPMNKTGTHYTDSSHICVDCDTVLRNGDAVIKEFNHVNGADGKLYAVTTGVANFVDLTKDIQHKEYWASMDVLPGKITMLSDERYDQIVRDAQSRFIRRHDLSDLLMAHKEVDRAFKYE